MTQKLYYQGYGFIFVYKNFKKAVDVDISYSGTSCNKWILFALCVLGKDQAHLCPA